MQIDHHALPGSLGAFGVLSPSDGRHSSGHWISVPQRPLGAGGEDVGGGRSATAFGDAMRCHKHRRRCDLQPAFGLLGERLFACFAAIEKREARS